jgi:hypothetical protein
MAAGQDSRYDLTHKFCGHVCARTGTMWGPPVISWFINPMNTIVISAINHSYWSYVAPNLAIVNGGPRSGSYDPTRRSHLDLHPKLGNGLLALWDQDSMFDQSPDI